MPPFDDPLVIAGQGTIGLELAEEVPDAAAVLVPVGGGGLDFRRGRRRCGVGAARARVVGVEAAGAAPMLAALRAGGPVELPSVDTMADGIAVRCVSQLTYEHTKALRRRGRDGRRGADQPGRMSCCSNGASGWSSRPARYRWPRCMAGAIPGDDAVVLVISGGNVDPLLLTRLVEHGLTAAGRYFMVSVVLPDKPGALASLDRCARGTRAQPVDGGAPAFRSSGGGKRSRGDPHPGDARPRPQGRHRAHPAGAGFPGRGLPALMPLRRGGPDAGLRQTARWPARRPHRALVGRPGGPPGLP